MYYYIDREKERGRNLGLTVVHGTWNTRPRRAPRGRRISAFNSCPARKNTNPRPKSTKRENRVCQTPAEAPIGDVGQREKVPADRRPQRVLREVRRPFRRNREWRNWEC